MGIGNSLLDIGVGGAALHAGAFLGFYRLGTAPERPWIDPAGIEGEHSIVEFTGGCLLSRETHEILDIAPCLSNVSRGVVRFAPPQPIHTSYTPRLRLTRMA